MRLSLKYFDLSGVARDQVDRFLATIQRDLASATASGRIPNVRDLARARIVEGTLVVSVQANGRILGHVDVEEWNWTLVAPPCEHRFVVAGDPCEDRGSRLEPTGDLVCEKCGIRYVREDRLLSGRVKVVEENGKLTLTSSV